MNQEVQEEKKSENSGILTRLNEPIQPTQPKTTQVEQGASNGVVGTTAEDNVPRFIAPEMSLKEKKTSGTSGISGGETSVSSGEASVSRVSGARSGRTSGGARSSQPKSGGEISLKNTESKNDQTKTTSSRNSRPATAVSPQQNSKNTKSAVAGYSTGTSTSS